MSMKTTTKLCRRVAEPVAIVLLYVGMAYLVVTLLLGAMARAAEPFVAINVASHHFDAAQDFEEVNPGLGLGVRQEFGGWRAEAEVGLYRNSYGDRTIYGVATGERVFGRFAVGVFAGLAEYPTQVMHARREGVPVIGDFLTVGGLSATAELNSRVSPG